MIFQLKAHYVHDEGELHNGILMEITVIPKIIHVLRQIQTPGHTGQIRTLIVA